MIQTLTRLTPTSHRTQKVHCIPVAHWMCGYWRQITVVQRSAVESFQWRQSRRLRVPIARSLIQWSTLCPCPGEPGRIRVRVLRTVTLLRVVRWVWIQEGCNSSVSRCICYLRKKKVLYNWILNKKIPCLRCFLLFTLRCHWTERENVHVCSSRQLLWWVLLWHWQG